RKRSKHLAGTKLCYRRRGASKAYTKRRSSLEASIFQYEFKFTGYSKNEEQAHGRNIHQKEE
ncbi:hypothetical protein S83_037378, partial [Arachis hypogaea]